MSDILTQIEADALISLEKCRVNENTWRYPHLGQKISIPLSSLDQTENFLLDVSRSRMNLAKNTYQNRARQIVVLLRLDISGPPHCNPDGEKILCPHLHVYREGFGDKWACPVPDDEFEDLNDINKTLTDFMRYCNVIMLPNIQQGLYT